MNILQSLILACVACATPLVLVAGAIHDHEAQSARTAILRADAQRVAGVRK